MLRTDVGNPPHLSYVVSSSRLVQKTNSWQRLDFTKHRILTKLIYRGACRLVFEKQLKLLTFPSLSVPETTIVFVMYLRCLKPLTSESCLTNLAFYDVSEFLAFDWEPALLTDRPWRSSGGVRLSNVLLYRLLRWVLGVAAQKRWPASGRLKTERFGVCVSARGVDKQDTRRLGSEETLILVIVDGASSIYPATSSLTPSTSPPPPRPLRRGGNAVHRPPLHHTAILLRDHVRTD